MWLTQQTELYWLLAVSTLLVLLLAHWLQELVACDHLAGEGFFILGILIASQVPPQQAPYWVTLLLPALLVSLIAALWATFTLALQVERQISSAMITLAAVAAFLAQGADRVFGAHRAYPLLLEPWYSAMPGLYVAVFLLLLTVVLMRLVPFGIMLKGIGQNQRAITNLGYEVNEVRWWVLIISALLCGLAGTHFFVVVAGSGLKINALALGALALFLLPLGQWRLFSVLPLALLGSALLVLPGFLVGPQKSSLATILLTQNTWIVLLCIVVLIRLAAHWLAPFQPREIRRASIKDVWPH